MHFCGDELNMILASLSVAGQAIQYGLTLCKLCLAQVRAWRG